MKSPRDLGGKTVQGVQALDYGAQPPEVIAETHMVEGKN